MSSHVTVLGCWAGAPHGGEAASGYLVSAGATRVLMDCGPGVALALSAQQTIAELDAVVISHRHADHCADLVALAFRRGFPAVLPPLPLYGPPDLQPILDGLDRLFGIPSLPELARPLSTAFAFHPVEPGARLQVAGLELRTFAARHSAPTLALRWPDLDLTYTADGAFVPELAHFAAGTAVLVAESTYVAAEGRDLTHHGHMTARQAGLLAQAADVGCLVLTHFASALDIEPGLAAARAVFGGPIVQARAGLVLPL